MGSIQVIMHVKCGAESAQEDFSHLEANVTVLINHRHWTGLSDSRGEREGETRFTMTESHLEGGRQNNDTKLQICKFFDHSQ